MTEMLIVLRATKIVMNATETKTENEIMTDGIEKESQKMALITEVHIVTPVETIAVEETFLPPPVDITQKSIHLPETRSLDMIPVEAQVDSKALDLKIGEENEVRLQNDVVLHPI